MSVVYQPRSVTWARQYPRMGEFHFKVGGLYHINYILTDENYLSILQGTVIHFGFKLWEGNIHPPLHRCMIPKAILCYAARKGNADSYRFSRDLHI